MKDLILLRFLFYPMRFFYLREIEFRHIHLAAMNIFSEEFILQQNLFKHPSDNFQISFENIFNEISFMYL